MPPRPRFTASTPSFSPDQKRVGAVDPRSCETVSHRIPVEHHPFRRTRRRTLEPRRRIGQHRAHLDPVAVGENQFVIVESAVGRQFHRDDFRLPAGRGGPVETPLFAPGAVDPEDSDPVPGPDRVVPLQIAKLDLKILRIAAEPQPDAGIVQLVVAAVRQNPVETDPLS